MLRNESNQTIFVQNCFWCTKPSFSHHLNLIRLHHSYLFNDKAHLIQSLYN